MRLILMEARGQLTTYEYDKLGRLVKLNYGVVNTVAAFSRVYTLDAGGNMTAMTDNTGSTAWVYDENNRVTSESRTQNGLTKTASYRYFDDGLMSSMTTLGGDTVSYSYDGSLRLSSQTDPKDLGRSISYTYDSRSRRTAISYGSGVKQQTTYDQAGRVDTLTLTNISGTQLQSYDYYYGFAADGTRQADYNKGNVVSLVEKTAGLTDSTLSYSYDELNRLTGATRTGQDAFTHSYSLEGLVSLCGL